MAVDYRKQWKPEMGSYLDPLVHLARELNPKRILEVGIGYDGFSAHVWLHETDAKVVTVDKRDWGGVGSLLEAKFPKRYKFVQGYSQDTLPKAKSKYDLIFIDGDHSYEGAKSDMLNCIPLLTPKGVIALDDCDVNFLSAVDIDDEGRIVQGVFGVGQAADEVFKDWKQIMTHIHLANGGRIYAKN